jgi:hypothetical protein
MRKGVLVLSAAVLSATAVLHAAPARAEGPKFGGGGQLVISDDQPLNAVAATGNLTPTPPGTTSTVSFEFASVSDNGGSGTSFVISPAADYFVINSLSVGGDVLFGVLSPAHGNTGSGSTTTLFGILPRVGYNLPITDTISFWPKVYFGYATASASNNGGSSNFTAIGVYAPFLFHLVPHFFVGIGPNLSTQLSNNVTPATLPGVASTTVSQPKVTELGIQATFGGWLLGD